AGLPLPTAHRLVGELAEWGALVQRPDGAYVVGRRLWDLGLLAPVQTDLRQTASPFLHDLYGATLATVHLAVPDGTEVLYVDRHSGHGSVPVVSQVGSRLPMHATGVGKALLAYAAPDIVAAVLADLRRVTPYTVTQPGRLRARPRCARRAAASPARGPGEARWRPSSAPAGGPRSPPRAWGGGGVRSWPRLTAGPPTPAGAPSCRSSSPATMMEASGMYCVAP